MQRFTGIPVSPGLVTGRCIEIKRRTAGLSRVLQAPQAEQHLFEAARILAQGELEALAQRADSEEQRMILRIQQALLDDVTFLDYVQDAVGRGAGALGAVEAARSYFCESMRRLDSAYFRARSADIEDICHRLADILAGQNHDHLVLREPAILAAEDVYPSDLIGIDRRFLLGMVVSRGSPQSHAAIIARTLGIPALILAGTDFLASANGSLMALDAVHGEFFLDPDEAVRTRFQHQLRLARRRTLYLEQLRASPCATLDGTPVALLGNSSNPADIRMALEQGAEGIGLLRSEFLFFEDHLPGEEEQLKFYCDCLTAAAGRPLTIRTLDAGADKQIAGISAEGEANPALGLRGIRLSLTCKNLLFTQFRALLRAAAQGGPLRILLPMIAAPEELHAAQAVLRQAEAQLCGEHLPYKKDVPLGIMIETPAAALLSGELAREAAFFSIGTNDLTQYTMAADRTNPSVATYYQPANPAVMKLVAMTLAAGARAGIPVSICGESAAVPELAARYVRMGARRLSMAGPSLAEVKDAVCHLDLSGEETAPAKP